MVKLQEKFNKEILPELKTKFGFKNSFQVPKVEKVVVNCGLGEIRSNQKLFDQAKSEIAVITGQIPIICKAKKAISGFKIRKGDPIALAVTLRGIRMYDFLERLINVVLPRIRDFKGLDNKGFDGHGNYTIAIKEQIVFLEVKQENIERIFGLQITIVTSAKNDQLAKELLLALGLIFKEK